MSEPLVEDEPSTIVHCLSVGEWVASLRKAQSAGHNLVTGDDPRLVWIPVGFNRRMKGYAVSSPLDEARKAASKEEISERRAELDAEVDGGLTEAHDLMIASQAKLARAAHVRCASFEEWATYLNEAKSQGHELFLCDDPRTLNLCFGDSDANTFFYLPDEGEGCVLARSAS